MSVDYTLQLEREYQSLYDNVTVPAAKQASVDQAVKSILANRARYKAVADRAGAPWQFVAVIHNMECSQNFKQHLHNGDPLTAKTVHVPAGRPASGTAPFSWEDSAVDALQLKKVQLWAKWNVPGVLYKLEEYNGWGYRLHHSRVPTPYLWSCCQHYTAGKYVADGFAGKGTSDAVRRYTGSGYLPGDPRA